MEMDQARMIGVMLTVALLAGPEPGLAQTAPVIDWVSVLKTQSVPGIQVSNCLGPDPRDPAAIVCVDVPGAPLPSGGYAETDHVTYGDIAGDGGTEAVVPLDSGGTIGENGSLIYTFDASGTPKLLLADGPGGSVFIDPNANELVSIEFDPNSCSSMTCPAGLVRTGYTLVSGTLQQQDTCEYLPSTADQNHLQGTCTPPESNAPVTAVAPGSPDFSGLRAFPGPVLIPPKDSPPFAGLPLLTARASTASGVTSYQIALGQDGGGNDEAIVVGVMTGAEHNDYAAQLSHCAANGGSYCYFPPDPDPAKRQGEFFLNLQARGSSGAIVGHNPAFGRLSEQWNIDWFDEKAGVTYEMEFFGNDILAMFAPPGTFSQSNQAGAQKIAALGNKLVAWSGS